MPPARRLVLVLVVDGLRPDSITAEDTPTLFRLRAEGVDLVNSHAVFPTVTRVNAAAIATGTQPGTNGLVGNQMFVPAVDERRAFDTGNHRNFLALDRVTGGRVLQAPTLAERLHARGLRLAGVSSGSTGSAFLLNPRSIAGVGALVNGYLEPGQTVAYPAPVSEAVLARFGPAPAKAPGGARFDAAVSWTQRVLREYVLPELAPDVVINWLTEPDHSQHHVGVGSPAAREALRNDDREIAQVLAGLDAARTSVLVVSDHGFTTNTAGVDVAGALIEAKLKAARDSTDVILASSGQAVALHVEGRDAERIARLARFIRSQDWGGVVFSAEAVEGAFPMELINVATRDRGPDLLFTFPWTSRRSAFGVPGTDLANVSAGGAPYVSDHGSMSPWNVRNTFLAWGAGVKKGIIGRAPAGNVDVTPTVLALLGLEGEAGLDGRVVAEALDGGPDPEAVAVETRVHTAVAGGYRAALQISTVDGRRYVDKSWRVS
ncbi:MAG TPA: alkaline phosphatase family protein [Methylomirabilota bacterium]|nr:alkaline phosphatase family protein [Methylomirabilota bacterium]